MKPVAPPLLQAQLYGLGTLVGLIKRARQAASADELAFIVVNESHALVPYRQAALWRGDGARGGQVVALSGTAVVERGAPYVQWLARLFRQQAADPAAAAALRPLAAADLAGTAAADWAEWLPPHGLLVPLAGPGARVGALLLARDEPWSEADRHLLLELADGYGHAWARFLAGRRQRLGRALRRRRFWLRLAALAAIAAVLALPVRLSVLAPAEVVALAPALVRAPLDGVVDRIAVQPNQPVNEGEALFALDPRSIENRLEVARKALAVAEAEYRTAAQQALTDDKSRAQLAALRGRAEQRRAEVDYARSLLGRISVTASRPGIALFGDPNDWLGRPVTLGEKVMEIADPQAAELEIWLPVADAINLVDGAEVEFFLNVAPQAPRAARLRQSSYAASMSPAGVLGYRLKASLAEPPAAAVPRIGLRGTAKLYGERVTLGYYLSRRPLAAARQFLGL